ncbi:MAG: hypothetical protein ABL886_08375, partial [Rhodoglobus sp.]
QLGIEMLKQRAGIDLLHVPYRGGAPAGTATVAAKGLGESGNPTAALSYSAPSSDVGGDVEVRNQRGQLDQAATQRAQQQQAAAAAAIAQQQNQGQPQQVQAPQQGGLRPSGRGPAQVGEARGAFGQRQDAGEPPPQNRAQRRAQEKRGR